MQGQNLASTARGGLQGNEHSGRRLTSKTRAKENVHTALMRLTERFPQTFVLEKNIGRIGRIGRSSRHRRPNYFKTLIPWLALCNARAGRPERA